MEFLRTCLTFSALTFMASNVSAGDFKTLVQDQIEGGPNPMSETIPYSYTVTINVDSDDDSEDENFNGQYRFNPSAPPGERIELIDMTWDDLPKDMRKELENTNLEMSETELAEDFWCNNQMRDLEMMASEAVTVIQESETEAVIALGPKAIAHFLADDSDKEERKLPKKLRKRMRSELTFSKPDLYLKNSHIWLSKPTTVKIVAKMNEMDFGLQCALASNGRPYVSGSQTKIAGKALGKAFQANVTIAISDLQPVK